MTREYDLLVLGGGPAGYPAAIRAAQRGAEVCLIEKGPLGGTCLNWGCIPTKTLHGTAHLIERLESAGEAGVGDGGAGIEAGKLFERKDRVVADLVRGIEAILEARKITVLRGEGRLRSRNEIEVESSGTVRGGRIIVATGSSELSLPGMDFDGEKILNSRDLLDLGRIPASMIIVGGGAIGCEFASIFNALGSRVSIVEMLPRLVAKEDGQISRALRAYFLKRGIGLHLGTRVAEADKGGEGVTVRLENGVEKTAELLLISVGRRLNVSGIGLEDAGIGFDAKGINADERMRTNVEGVYAAGDVVGGHLLAHVATREGIVAAENALGRTEVVRYDAVPSTIYTLPEISRVGITEEEAREKGMEVIVGRAPFAANGKAKGLGEEEGFVKWVVSKEDERLLGLHVIGGTATELVGPAILAVGRGMTLKDFTSSVFPHPTLSESLAEAAEAAKGVAIHVIR